MVSWSDGGKGPHTHTDLFVSSPSLSRAGPSRISRRGFPFFYSIPLKQKRFDLLSFEYRLLERICFVFLALPG